MKYWRYQALDPQKKLCRGKIQAENERSARMQLQQQQLIPVQLCETRAWMNELPSWLHQRNGLTSKERVLFIRQLATLISAALPLEEALKTLIEQCEKPAQRELLSKLHHHILEGMAFSDALAGYPRFFQPLLRATVAAGEASGHLGSVLLRLADNLEQRQKVNSKLLQALLYPLILTVIAVGVVTLLLTAVVPDIVAQFVHMRQVLPLSTRILMASSEALKIAAPWIGGGIALASIGIHFWLKKPTHRIRWHQFQLTLPLAGNVVRELNLARYARTLSILHTSAVPLLDAMRISADVLTNTYARQQLLQAREQVREGSTLIAALIQTGLLTPMMRNLIGSGERSGELGNMLEHTADIQENAFFSRMSLTVALFEPLLIVGMASIVLFIILAILQPILQLNTMMN
ncbi:type II secretion system inner membrane protein GspF [Enterobacter mori]|uniref:type II secretion system inner membrane protein GspF n=1 Tax=Enterobacter mori TaxID=539813 RepID=UPI001B8B26FB|nr:type II secretion system inner membrane protein GspF [Enterobacter mori]MBS3050494.1 type II secretion system inner membrane protein GspF [Enterobacter mori]